ncbi:flagellar biosynthetic protein FliO [Pseudochrobactrum kiredjianiae]|uniref:Flagellar biosynthetic protein FliO n=1 Tax=Pseudochrobactrum kiredjianiae TaxID=386305 RepID=A0ABW3V4A6_9HYPH|nr:flagellar biosynthetic protein FliO [Pseudochrobactrum kiredjianiae]MDM7851777.1 flagellar biosynthetic protein FliO [Pseudochrobactrum kiredjianiae]
MMDWLSGLVGENTAHIISFIGLFALFLAGVFVVFAAIKRMTAGTYVTRNPDAAPRLTVTDAAAIDSQRRLVLVRRDDVEHLILIGGPSDIVIEQNITRNKSSQPVQAAQPTQRMRQPEERATIAPAVAAPVIARAPAVSTEQALSAAPADIIAATPAYKPEAEAPVPQPRPTASAPAVTQVAAPSQPLQTHAQQVAAARQQQSQKPQPVARPTAESAAAKLHPVYPLGQVSRGVIAATSGLAAANNAAQQELIAAAKRDSRSATPSLDDVRPGSGAIEGNPLVSQRATPQATPRMAPQEPSFGVSPVAAPAARPAPQPSFELDLENAVAEALSSKELATDNEISFEDLLSSEMDQHFAASEKTEQPATSTLDISPRK